MSEAKRALLKQLLAGTTNLTNLQDLVEGAIYVSRGNRFTRNGKAITEAQYNARHPACPTIQVIRFKKTIAE